LKHVESKEQEDEESVGSDDDVDASEKGSKEESKQSPALMRPTFASPLLNNLFRSSASLYSSSSPSPSQIRPIMSVEAPRTPGEFLAQQDASVYALDACDVDSHASSSVYTDARVFSPKHYSPTHNHSKCSSHDHNHSRSSPAVYDYNSLASSKKDEAVFPKPLEQALPSTSTPPLSWRNTPASLLRLLSLLALLFAVTAYFMVPWLMNSQPVTVGEHTITQAEIDRLASLVSQSLNPAQMQRDIRDHVMHEATTTINKQEKSVSDKLSQLENEFKKAIENSMDSLRGDVQKQIAQLNQAQSKQAANTQASLEQLEQRILETVRKQREAYASEWAERLKRELSELIPSAPSSPSSPSSPVDSDASEKLMAELSRVEKRLMSQVEQQSQAALSGAVERVLKDDRLEEAVKSLLHKMLDVDEVNGLKTDVMRLEKVMEGVREQQQQGDRKMSEVEKKALEVAQQNLDKARALVDEMASSSSSETKKMIEKAIADVKAQLSHVTPDVLSKIHERIDAIQREVRELQISDQPSSPSSPSSPASSEALKKLANDIDSLSKKLEQHSSQISDLVSKPAPTSAPAPAFDQSPAWMKLKQDVDELSQKLAEQVSQLSSRAHTMDEVQQQQKNMQTAIQALQKALAELQHQRDADSSSPSGPSGSLDGDMRSYVLDAIERRIRRLQADNSHLVDYALRAGVIQSSPSHCEPVPPLPEQAGAMEKLAHKMRTAFTDCVVSSPDPDIALDPSMVVGSCWPMEGSSGFMDIKLKETITVSRVAIEHPVNTVLPHPKSAPKSVEFYGLEGDEETFLAGFSYELGQDQLQSHAVADVGKAFGVVRVKFLSNHGDPTYTCIYRIRVHGTPVASD